MFTECGELSAIELPEGLEIIGRECFSESGLCEITVPRGVREISDCAFYACVSLTSIVFQNDGVLKTIGEACFYESGLDAVVFPQSLEETRACAFEAHLLMHVQVPDTCRVGLVIDGLGLAPLGSENILVGRRSLARLRTLKTVTLPEGLETIKNHWFSQSTIEKITIPASVTTI